MPRPRKPDPVDVHVGKKLQVRRTLCGLSQSELAERLGITFQQLQKYETAANRISASRLWQASKVLEVPVSYFFTGLDGEVDPAAEILSTRAGLELVRDFEGCAEEVQGFVSRLCAATVEDIKSASGKKAK
jgi:transcriptional regulator with XRE-family HTH domain